MNIRLANNRIYEIDERIDYLLNKKEEEITKVLPRATKFEADKVFSTRVESNANLYYIIENEKIDAEIDFLSREKDILLSFIEKELRRLKKYHEIENIIIYYRENKLRKYTWEKIAHIVNLSERQCINIYQKYRKQRNV